MTPASFVAAKMRIGSRTPGFPVSMSTDSPEGVTKRVAFPPSTSTTYISSGLVDGVCARRITGDRTMLNKQTTRLRIAIRLADGIFYGPPQFHRALNFWY